MPYKFVNLNFQSNLLQFSFLVDIAFWFIIIDIDECTGDFNPCSNGTCHNINGSYNCDCDGGFKLIGQEEFYNNHTCVSGNVYMSCI